MCQDGIAVCSRRNASEDILEVFQLLIRSFFGPIMDIQMLEILRVIPSERSSLGDRKHQYYLDPDDPWPEGYRLSDTWPDFKRVAGRIRRMYKLEMSD